MTPPPRIGLCTDSSAQLPTELIDRYGIVVVPITIGVDDHDYLENVDLDADGFYDMFADGRRPTITTSQPSPGQFAVAYDELVDKGCTEILSVHVGAGLSGTINSARLAAHGLDIPVRLVDSGTASFGVGCCVWAAAEAIAGGATLDEAALVAEQLAPTIGNVFIAGAMDLLRHGGRGGRVAAGTSADDGVPVLTLRNGTLEVVERVANLVDAVNAMAGYALRWVPTGDDRRPGTVVLKVAVGTADRDSAPLGAALEAALEAAGNVEEVVRYRVGPSVGAHTGPGTAGCFMFPSPSSPERTNPTAS
jgi:DegV family protein with EDD domain